VRTVTGSFDTRTPCGVVTSTPLPRASGTVVAGRWYHRSSYSRGPDGKNTDDGTGGGGFFFVVDTNGVDDGTNARTGFRSYGCPSARG
jgi:hypothetical protein